MRIESIYKNYMPAVSEKNIAHGLSYFFIFYLDRILVKNEDGKVSIPVANDLEELKIIPLRKQYLGIYNGQPCFSVELSSDEVMMEDMSYMGLRALYGAVDEDVFLLAGKAFQVVNWDKTHKFCGSCGTETFSMETERAKKCPKCGHMSFPVLSPAVITAILKGNKILLAHNRNFRGNMYSLIAGFVEPGETLEETVKREVMEEVGLNVKNVKYFSSQPWPFPNSLMIGFTAEYESGEIAVDGEEINHAAWFDVNNLPELPGEISIARKLINWFIDNYK
jgi:NAD+ diphosphatase